MECVSVNLYEISYPGWYDENPDYSVLRMAKTAGAAKYNEYLEISDCLDMTFIEFCKAIKCRKIGQSSPTKKEEPFYAQDRIDVINQLIIEIGSRGRKFLYSGRHNRYATFHWAGNKLWYTDDYTGIPIVMEPKNSYRTRDQGMHFSHGGTLWGLVNDFKDYIFGDDESNHNNGYGGLYCPHWGYPEDDMEAIRDKAKSLGYLK